MYTVLLYVLSTDQGVNSVLILGALNKNVIDELVSPITSRKFGHNQS